MAKRLRRSMLYIPGNNPGKIQDAVIYGTDSILLDLEDAIAVGEKDAARNMVKNALNSLDFKDIEVTVRINPLTTEFGQLDLETIVPAGPDAIRLPKTESANQVNEVDSMISRLEEKAGLEFSAIKLMPMIETALGIQEAYNIACASKRVVALTIGGEDLTADLGVERTNEGMEILTARSLIVLAAKAAGVEALDTVYSKVSDIEGLKKETTMIKKLGFTGKAVIHPLQIKPVHEVFQPTAEEINSAKRIVKAAREAEEKGIGVITVDGKMVDGPIITRAERVLAYGNAD